jgi:uncharacterized membrane protein (DUF2068 family)
VLGGIAGAVLIDAYILAVGALSHRLTPEQLYTYVASGLIGKAAYSFPGTAALGVAMHLVISAGWGIGYAYAALGSRQLVDRPAVSGIAFGLFVYLIMQIVEALIGIWHAPSANDAFTAIVAHTIFFGLPVAYIVAKRLRVVAAA